MNYELFYLIGASHEANLEKIKKDVEKIILENEGAFEELEISEKKRLAYKVKHETYGLYIARRFEIEPEKISEINKKLNLYPDILRFMISKSADLPELKIKEEGKEKRNYPAAPEKFEKKKEVVPVQSKAPAEKEESVFSKEDKKTEEDIDKKLEEILNI